MHDVIIGVKCDTIPLQISEVIIFCLTTEPTIPELPLLGVNFA